MKNKLRNMLGIVIILMAVMLLGTSSVLAATTLKIKKQPVSVTVSSGETAKVSVSAKGDGLKYKWYYKDKGSSKFKATSAFKSNTYKVEMNKDRAGRQVYCKITDKYGNSVKTKTVTLSRGKTLKISTQPVSVTASKGSTAKVTLKAQGSGLTYKWYYKDKGSSKYKVTDAFKDNSYSIKMNASRAGRKVYCVVTDKYGSSVKSDVVTLSQGKTLKIKTQPKSVTVLKGSTAKVSIKVQGEGLTYKWYYKDKGSSKFKATSSFKSNSYSIEMDSRRSGRQVYCVVKDKFGSTVKTQAATLSMGTPLKITKQPASVTVDSGKTAKVSIKAQGDGLTYKWYYKDANSSEFKLTTSYTGNTYSVEMNASRAGRQVYCVVTDKGGTTVKTNVATLIVKGKYVLNVDSGVGEKQVISVGKDGKYKLTTPSIPGYTFKGWKDSSGKTFKSSGTIKSNKTVHAVWEIDGTNTLKELVERTNLGVRDIKITANITVTKPIYISYDTTIYSSGDYTIKRDTEFKGDMFVVGQDKNGKSSVSQGRQAELTLSTTKGTLTIDGNRSKTKVNVAGSAIYVDDSSNVNIHKGVRIANHNKVSNDRIFDCTYYTGESAAKRAGGAAICIVNGIVNMYDGVIENNTSLAKNAVTTDKDGNTIYNDAASCGGAIYNRGTFNMYGGTIRLCNALTGGAIYNERNAIIEAGTIEGNEAKTYGGAIASSAVQYAQLFAGNEESDKQLTISNNKSSKAGGAIYSNTHSPIVIHGNTTFEGNKSSSIGGAIYTGGALTVNDTVFESNTSSSQGGAIYHKFSNTDYTRRNMEVVKCTFNNNKATEGGAVALGATSNKKNVGTYAVLSNCTFTNNIASSSSTDKGNGGAVYATYYTTGTIKKCTFKANSATGGAGAVYVHKGSTMKITDSTFVENTALRGAALNVESGSVTLTNGSMKNNVASEGGTIYGDPENIQINGTEIDDK